LPSLARSAAENLAGPVVVMRGKPKQGPVRGQVVNLDRMKVSWFADTPEDELA
jgi:hypothetical protein